jgi:hypothetical protein
LLGSAVEKPEFSFFSLETSPATRRGSSAADAGAESGRKREVVMRGKKTAFLRSDGDRRRLQGEEKKVKR